MIAVTVLLVISGYSYFNLNGEERKMSQELYEEIARLTIENERIKKTSKQRFDKNKKIESEFTYLKMELSRVNAIKDFLKDSGFSLRSYRGQFHVAFSVFDAIKSLKDIGVKNDKPTVDGIYAVKWDGERKIVKIEHRLCWMLMCKETNKYSGQTGIHQLDMSEFTLLEAL
ncbi:coil containing protein [Vibrio phage 1.256.O._10N.286.45.F8]|nr:coil containing protein [Vibrio phage 1.256.O._10N.286.45.F8]